MCLKRKKRKAFTLIELMLAVSILTLVVTGLLMTYISCILLNQTNVNQTKASAEAEFILEELSGRLYENIEDEEKFEVTSLKDGEGTVYVLNEDATKGKKEIAVEVTWVERNRDMNLKLFTVFHE